MRPEKNLEIKSNLKPEEKQNLKTTNINILLNRVKLDKKREIKKKIIFLILISTILVVIGTLLI